MSTLTRDYPPCSFTVASRKLSNARVFVKLEGLSGHRNLGIVSCNIQEVRKTAVGVYKLCAIKIARYWIAAKF